jgi:replicative superfamily II helicase
VLTTKGHSGPSQEAVLREWYARQASTRDVIVKLHTGQGKTLAGLLMLQSRLNAGKGPVVYLCPDHFLIAQTCEQARQFGIRTCTADDDLPDEFQKLGLHFGDLCPETVQWQDEIRAE